jgi:predicted DCC family thiol-disulfide oxidoreductase YuxK
VSYPVVRFTVAGQAMEEFHPTRPYVVVYDGNCRVCTRLANVLRRWDRRGDMEVIPSQTPGLAELYPFISADDYRQALQMIGPDSTRWQGAEAIDKILSLVPRGALLRWPLHLPFAPRAADRFYKWFARNRYRFGCGEHCEFRPGAN